MTKGRVGSESNIDRVAILGRQKTTTVTIANGQAISSVVESAGYRFFGLAMPGAFTSASISFSVSADGTNFNPLYDSANALVSVTVAINRNYALPTTLAGWPYFKIVAVGNEGGARSLVVTAQA